MEDTRKLIISRWKGYFLPLSFMLCYVSFAKFATVAQVEIHATIFAFILVGWNLVLVDKWFDDFANAIHQTSSKIISIEVTAITVALSVLILAR